ncbi:MAG: 1-deoxy-D-xylulose-5-phosphate reductoisomerase, partial [Verrucomicrobiae bacterium]|nr:1-deoxy-D-xylulose-5-phosphate reductoisomerase [Verrucomicrobiae bacterium]
AALQAGKDIAVASKEILVMAGEIVMAEAGKHGRRVLPVDSEHSAIWQCLENRPQRHIKNLWLTASGGPFRKTPKSEFSKITRADALKHPTWNMGAKITIDSSTLMNKGLEMIEAKWLFGVEIDRVQVVIHPQSIIHSMVEFIDGSILAQLSEPNMRYPIQYALTYPDRAPNTMAPIDFGKISTLHFEEPDHDRFPALGLARQAAQRGGTTPAVFNAANEVAVERFARGDISFPGIWETVAGTLEKHQTVAHPSLEVIVEADRWARAHAATKL